MSEEMQHDDALEQRIRAHYASALGQPPSPAAVWASLQEKLPPPSPGEANSTPAVQWRPALTRPAATFPASSHQTYAHRLLSTLSIVAAALLVALFATVLLHPFGHTGGNSTATPTLDESLPDGFTVHVLAPDEVWHGTALNDFQMLSSEEGWAVGAHNTSKSFESVILRYAHGKWSASRDVFPNVYLTSISMLSSTDGWASGGGNSTDAATLLHYSGGHWTAVKAPGQGEIGQLTMLTSRDGWAIQFAPNTEGPHPFRASLLHYDGTAWSIADTGGMPLMTLAMLSSSEGWAAGYDGVIAHVQNGTWTRWPTTAPGDVTHITMVSPTDGWMTGLAPGYSADPNFQRPHHMFVLHYNGHEWQPVTLPELPNLLHVYPSATNYQNSPSIYSISAVSMASPQEGWAAGSLVSIASVLYHYSGGKWHLYPFGVNALLTGIQMVSAGEGWAIGDRQNYDNSSEDATILHYAQGSWTIYKP